MPTGSRRGKGSRLPDRNEVQIGYRIRERRKQVGLNQEALGDRVGVTFQQIQKYERGANRISIGRLSQIAEALMCLSLSFLRPSLKLFTQGPMHRLTS